MEKKYYIGSKLQIIGHQIEIGKSNRDTKTKFSDGVRKSERKTRVVGIEIKDIRRQNKALKDLKTAHSCEKTNSKKSANNK